MHMQVFKAHFMGDVFTVEKKADDKFQMKQVQESDGEVIATKNFRTVSAAVSHISKRIRLWADDVANNLTPIVEI
jgi:hypothetical protein